MSKATRLPGKAAKAENGEMDSMSKNISGCRSVYNRRAGLKDWAVTSRCLVLLVRGSKLVKLVLARKYVTFVGGDEN